MIKILRQRRLAIWIQCPTCGKSYSYPKLPPSAKWRAWSELCPRCNSPMTITKRRYYTIYAEDFYDRAGTCRETCSLYYPNPRAFRIALTEARRKELAYQEQQREQARKWAAERELLKQAETVAMRVIQAGVLDAEEIARSAWEASKPPRENDDFDPFLD